MTVTCSHPGSLDRYVCTHVAVDDDLEYFLRFTGSGVDYVLVCAACADEEGPALEGVCAACFASRQRMIFDASGVRGRPEVRSRASLLAFEHRPIRIPRLDGAQLAALAPVNAGAGPSWLVVVSGALARLTLDPPRVAPVLDLAGAGLELAEPVQVTASPDGRFAAVVNVRGRRGVVVDVVHGAITMHLDRGEYHEEVCDFSAGLFDDAGRAVLVHATAWNRLDLSDPENGRLLTPRVPTERVDGAAPPHYLNYFHAGLTVSPDGRWLVDDGWVWHPVGILRSLDLRRWCHDNPWESEDGPSVRELRTCAYYWDGPRCFADDRTLVTWGFGLDDEHLIDAAVLHEVETGQTLRWFAGPPRGRFVVDGRHLIVIAAAGTTVWDLDTGERLLDVPGFAPIAYHAGVRCHLSVALDGTLVASYLRDG